jgi:hypothetical protein
MQENGLEVIEIFTSCPACALLHVDEGEWRDHPHSEHLCARCGARWTPIPCVRTRGVPALPKYGPPGYLEGPFGRCRECAVPLYTSNARCGRCAGRMAALGGRVAGSEVYGVGLFQVADTLELRAHEFCPGDDAKCEAWAHRRMPDGSAGPLRHCGEPPSRHFVRREDLEAARDFTRSR